MMSLTSLAVPGLPEPSLLHIYCFNQCIIHSVCGSGQSPQTRNFQEVTIDMTINYIYADRELIQGVMEKITRHFWGVGPFTYADNNKPTNLILAFCISLINSSSLLNYLFKRLSQLEPVLVLKLIMYGDLRP